MRHSEAEDSPRLVCPACGGIVDPATQIGGVIVCPRCRLHLDLTALVDRLSTLLDRGGGPDDPDPVDEVVIDLWLHNLDLSAREGEVLALLLQGFRAGQIALRTGVSVSTVRKRLRRLLAKTGTSSQAELVARCRARGVEPGRVAERVVDLVDPDPGDQAEASRSPSRRSRSPRT
jgi:DNA-binding CsgD family transcriptional regulator